MTNLSPAVVSILAAHISRPNDQKPHTAPATRALCATYTEITDIDAQVTGEGTKCLLLLNGGAFGLRNTRRAHNETLAHLIAEAKAEAAILTARAA